MLEDFERDGVVYLELRTTPRTAPGMDKDSYVNTILSCIKAHGGELMMVHLILSIDRRNTASEAMDVVDLAMKYHSEGVVGVDLCGDPSKGEVATFREAFAKAKSHGLGITLHFAEVPGAPNTEELETLLSFEPDRLGHVIHVPDHLKDEIRRRRLGLELCISCNVKAKLTEGEVADHHFKFWKGTECPTILGVGL